MLRTIFPAENDPPLLIHSDTPEAATRLQAQQPKILTEAYLSTLRQEAVNSHPAAKAAALRAEAAALDVRAVRLWNDPMLGMSVMFADPMMRKENGDIHLGFEQALPKRGLHSASRDKAEAMRREATENTKSSSLEVGMITAKDAIELALTDEAIVHQTAQITWLTSLVENARQRVANPDASSVEALRLESELTRETQIFEAAKRNRESIAQKLNLSLGRPLDAPWPILALPVKPPPVPVASSEIARIPHANPAVRAMVERASVAHAETRITKSERLPEVAVGIDSAMYSGGDVVSTSVGIKVSLLWFNDPIYQARTDAARAREKSASAEVESTRREVADKILSAATDAANAAAQARAWAGDVYTRTLHARDATQASWISSKSSLTDVLESNKVLFSIRLEQRRFIAMELAALEDLNLLVPKR